MTPTRTRIHTAAMASILTTGLAMVLAGPATAAARSVGPAPASSPAAWDTPLQADAPARANAASPWWMAFNDATLNLLVHAAQHRQAGLMALQAGQASPSVGEAGMSADEARGQVVASYLGARVMSARWIALNGLRNAAERQQQLLSNATPGGEAATAEVQEAMASLQQRSDRVGQQQQALAQERETLLRNLGSLCGLPSAELADLLAPALNQSTVPAFGSAVPVKLPKSILRARPDVATAEAAVLRSLRSTGSPQHEVVARMQQADGWIAVDGDLSTSAAAAKPVALLTSDPASTPTPELDDLRALLDHAAQEVAEDLRSLNERARLQSERAQLADASRMAFLAARDRLKTGEVTELQVLEQYQRLLAESDRYVSACGELAMAWLRLVASTGASDQVLVRQ